MFYLHSVRSRKAYFMHNVKGASKQRRLYVMMKPEEDSLRISSVHPLTKTSFQFELSAARVCLRDMRLVALPPSASHWKGMETNFCRVNCRWNEKWLNACQQEECIIHGRRRRKNAASFRPHNFHLPFFFHSTMAHSALLCYSLKRYFIHWYLLQRMLEKAWDMGSRQCALWSRFRLTNSDCRNGMACSHSADDVEYHFSFKFLLLIIELSTHFFQFLTGNR